MSLTWQSGSREFMDSFEMKIDFFKGDSEQHPGKLHKGNDIRTEGA